MRYKFRGKRIDNGDWVYGDYFYGYADYSYMTDKNKKHWIQGYDEKNHYFIHEVDGKTVGQYTGLKDKNGKEIYDGDIAKRGDGRTDTITYEDGEYTTEKQGWGLTWLIKHRLGDMGENIEIIGNIHDKGEEHE